MSDWVKFDECPLTGRVKFLSIEANCAATEVLLRALLDVFQNPGPYNPKISIDANYRVVEFEWGTAAPKSEGGGRRES